MRRIDLDGVVDYARELIAACVSTEAAFPVRQRVDLAGLSVDVHSDQGALACAIARGIATSAPGSGSPVSVFVAHPGIVPQALPAQWGGEQTPQQAFSARLEASGLRGSYFHDLRYWQFHDVEKKVGVQVMTSADSCPPWEFGAPLRCFLHWEYAARGQRLTHAGTLGIDGRGVLLAGSGGAGKSGTVVAGLLAGLDSVGDDYVLMDLSDGRVTARPLFTTLKQDPSGFERLGLGAYLAEPGELNWQGKYQFRVQDIAPRGVADRLEIAALVVPRISGGNRSSIEPISRKEALMALAPSGIAQMPGERDSGFRFFSELTRRLPCFRLSLGRRGDEIAETITAFLEKGRP